MLRELRTNDNVIPELKDEYEYDIVLREKLVKSWELAQEALKGVKQSTHRTFYQNGSPDLGIIQWKSIKTN